MLTVVAAMTMGVGSSKACNGNGGSPSLSSSATRATRLSRGATGCGVRKVRSKGKSGILLSCFSSSPGSDIENDADERRVPDDENKDDSNDPCTSQVYREPGQVECFTMTRSEQPDATRTMSSNVELGGCDDQVTVTDKLSQSGSSSARGSSRQLTDRSSSFLASFKSIPGNASFRLNRANSLGSLRSYPVSIVSEIEEETEVHAGPSSGLVNKHETQQGNEEHAGFTDNLLANHLTPNDDLSTDCFNIRPGVDFNLSSTRSHVEIGSSEMAERQTESREQVRGNALFSRTLSVGRVCDRVVCGPSFPDLSTSPSRNQREIGGETRGSERQAGGDEMRERASETTAVASPTTSTRPLSSTPSSLLTNRDYDMVAQSTLGNFFEAMERRSNFFDRRRRIRSQLHALQQLGNGFENRFGHARTYILSSRHVSSRYTYRTSSHDANSNDRSGTRAGISRIVMLAEALFEVLDEIHQQSVALSAIPSGTYIRFIPAPSEVVESLPVKSYNKLQKHQNEDRAQCYICLVEYDEEDVMRVLPCHHEFHKSCVDRWLKEVHRNCPLCRRDVCRSV